MYSCCSTAKFCFVLTSGTSRIGIVHLVFPTPHTKVDSFASQQMCSSLESL